MLVLLAGGPGYRRGALHAAFRSKDRAHVHADSASLASRTFAAGSVGHGAARWPASSRTSSIRPPYPWERPAEYLAAALDD